MNLQEFFQSIDYQTRSYSGRGMYGKACVGVEVSNGSVGNLFAECLVGIDEHLDKDELPAILEMLREAFSDMRTDSMGRNDTIVYFPNVKWEVSDDE